MSRGYEIADQLDAAYASLCATFGLLDTEELEHGQMGNGWSPKAVLAHIAFWDEYQTKRMQAALVGTSAEAGFPPPLTDNDQRVIADREHTWESALAMADSARSQMIDFARGLSDTALQAEYPEGEATLSLEHLLEHMVRHTRLHAQELRQFCGSMQRWSRQALRTFIVEQHANLMDSISHLTEETIVTTQISGEWSIRDLLVHVLSWDEYGDAVLKQWPDAAGESLTPWLDGRGVDDINANLLAERETLNMIDICDGLMTYHRQGLRLFDRMSDEQLAGSGNYGWGETGTLSNFFYGLALHTAEHAEELWRYRAEHN